MIGNDVQFEGLIDIIIADSGGGSGGGGGAVVCRKLNLEEPVRVRPAQPGLTWRNPSGWPAQPGLNLEEPGQGGQPT